MSEYSWDIKTPMIVTIRHNNAEVMRISIAEIIESSSRKDVFNHIAECDRTPWLKRWNIEKHEALVELLKK